jgi:hypothetical protein
VAYTFASAGTYTLVFEVANSGFYGTNDSYLGVDNVQLVPEPLSAAGMLLGLGGLVGYLRRRRMA